MMYPYYSGGYGTDGLWGGGMIGMMIIGGFFFLLFIAGIVLLVVWLGGQAGRSMMSPPGMGQTKDEALEILKKRYASGEITKEQFEQMKKDLS